MCLIRMADCVRMGPVRSQAGWPIFTRFSACLTQTIARALQGHTVCHWHVALHIQQGTPVS